MIVKIHNQLGNQMFMYASIKSICKETGNQFQFFMDDTILSNSNDSKYGNTIDKVFDLEPSEKTDYIPSEFLYFKEKTRNRRVNYLPGIKKFRNGTVVEGLFQSSKYFESKKIQVKNWFEFNKELKYKTIEKLKEVKQKYGEDFNLCFVHFRQGNDYKKFGYAIDLKYYRESLRVIKDTYKNKIIFVVFYDVKDKKIDNLFKGYHHEYLHGSLVEDLCCMTLCDAGIISNSTFSWWGAYLQNSAEIIIRPSDFFAFGTSISPEDIFPSDWISIKAERRLQTKIFGYLIEKTSNARLFFKRNYSKQYFLLRRLVSKILGLKFNKI